MASLTGVKTLDMVNGEITRVSYNGIEYVKVDGPAQAGDLALRHPSVNNLDITAGCFYEVAKAYEDKVRISDDVDELAARKQSMFSFFRKEVEKYTAPKLKVGDYVRITGNDVNGSLGDHGFKIGEVVRVRALPEDLTHKDRIMGENLDGGKYGYVYINDFVKASSEEVAEAKRAAKWAKLGRKPNEFKQGDIVRVISTGLPDLRKGELGIVGEVDDDIFRVCGRLSSVDWVDADEVELVAPAESRVDVE